MHKNFVNILLSIMYSGSLKMDANQSFSNSISLSDRINTTIKDQVEQFEVLAL
jgi:hypothetical protein